MSNLGFSVMLNMLKDNSKIVKLYNESIGKIIKSAEIEENELRIVFSDGKEIVIYDNGQSCCEDRYMSTDDNLSEFKGHALKKIELKNGDGTESDWGEHEILFLEITTDKGFFQIVNHNEHNGYYGGFSIEIKEL
jgi:hypothetical protein